MSGMTPQHSTLSTATNKVAALEGNMRNILPVVILIFYSAFVLCEQMDWGENDYLVDESDTIQGREHIKLIVDVVGDTIELECQVAFTSEPVSEVQ